MQRLRICSKWPLHQKMWTTNDTDLLLGVHVHYFSDVKQVTVKGWQTVTRLNVEPLELSLRLVNARVEKFPLGLLQNKENVAQHVNEPKAKVLHHVNAHSTRLAQKVKVVNVPSNQRKYSHTKRVWRVNFCVGFHSVRVTPSHQTAHK